MLENAFFGNFGDLGFSRVSLGMPLSVKVSEFRIDIIREKNFEKYKRQKKSRPADFQKISRGVTIIKEQGVLVMFDRLIRKK